MKGTQISLHPPRFNDEDTGQAECSGRRWSCVPRPGLSREMLAFPRGRSANAPQSSGPAPLLGALPTLEKLAGLGCGPWTSSLSSPRHYDNSPVQGQVRLMLDYFLVMAIAMLIVYGNRQ